MRQARYTVKQVAELTGVLETTLRVWERRYAVVSPERSEAGYRRYDDAQVDRLRRMAALVASGVPASVAAESLSREQEEQASTPAGPSNGDLVSAARSLDPRCLDAVLASGLSGPLTATVDEWLMPELVKVGHAWFVGELTVAHEHFVSAGVQRALGRLFDSAPGPQAGGTVLVGVPAGGHHELGTLAFATCLRRRGVDVVYLGADVPLTDWLAAASAVLPRGVVVGVPLRCPVRRAQELVDRLTTHAPPLPLWVGGALAARIRGGIRLPTPPGAAASVLADAILAGTTHLV